MVYRELICEAWVKAGNGDEKAFRSYWKHLPKAEKDVCIWIHYA